MSKTQEQAVRLVREHPGATIQFIADRLECTHTTASYHLDLLVQRALIVRERDGRVVRHYCGPGDGPIDFIRFEHFLRDEGLRNLIELLLAEEKRELSPNEIARRVGRNFGAVKRALQRLEEHGLVFVERQGSPRYYVQATSKLKALAAEHEARRVRSRSE